VIELAVILAVGVAGYALGAIRGFPLPKPQALPDPKRCDVCGQDCVHD
jgi:hypothetical protein